jgi:hypothetical protein
MLATRPRKGSTMGDAVRLDDFRGYRYGEILNVYHSEERGSWAEVWNTMLLNECPPEEFDAIDFDAFAAEHGALFAFKNGPRFWIWDALELVPPAERRLATAGGLSLQLVATLELGDDDPTRIDYVERSVARDNVWEFAAHRPRFYLHAPDGTRYVMQAYAIYVDPSLRYEDLVTLGDRLLPPDGWRYEADLDPSTVLRVNCGVEKRATVLQDELANTYQRLASYEEIPAG